MTFNFLSRTSEVEMSANVTKKRVEAFCIGSGKWNLEGKIKKKGISSVHLRKRKSNTRKY